MIELMVIIGFFVAIDVLALRFGADSRDGDDWSWRHHAHPARSRIPS
jgi:hypothetical protein